MKKPLFFKTLLLAPALLGLVTACPNKEMGIFFSIENERKLNDNVLPNNATLTGMIKITETSPNVDRYVASTGYLYWVRAVDNFDYHLNANQGGRWERLDPPETGWLCSALVYSGTTSEKVFAVFYNPNASVPTGKLYYADPGVWPLGWTEITLSTNNIAATAQDVKIANDQAFILGYTGAGPERDYFVWNCSASNPSALTTAVTGLDLGKIPSAYFDAAYAGSKYYVSYGYRLFESTSPSGSFSTPSGYTLNTTDAYLITGLLASSFYTDHLFILQKGRGILFYDGGTNWDSAANLAPAVPRSLAEIELTAGPNTGKYLLLATETGGYEYQVPASPDGTAIDFVLPTLTTNGDNYKTLELRLNPALRFFFDKGITTNSNGQQDVIFALTAGYGLWGNRAGSSDRQWNRE
ncbi:MAG: hypothetical protein LBQ61_02995 [Spirochaetales bacterium]|jgi:hypothetical protein|nr:hypothetical protein [Spirochaetales bacterium]